MTQSDKRGLEGFKGNVYPDVSSEKENAWDRNEESGSTRVRGDTDRVKRKSSNPSEPYTACAHHQRYRALI